MKVEIGDNVFIKLYGTEKIFLVVSRIPVFGDMGYLLKNIKTGLQAFVFKKDIIKVIKEEN